MEQKKSTVILPEGWIEVKLEDIALSIDYGYTAKSTTKNTGVKFLRITDIQDNRVNWNSVPFCVIDEYEKSKYLINDGDIVFARTGATVGKSFLIKGKSVKAVFASYLIRIRMAKILNPVYVYHFFQSSDYWRQINKKAKGVGQPNVNGSSLSKLIIPLPPLKEQHLIVSRIEELFSELDHAEEGLKKAHKQLEVYKQALLKSAFEGKLTEKWREENSIPKWQVGILGEISSFIGSGSTPKGGRNVYSDNGIPFIRSLNVRSNLFSWNDIVYISEYIHENMSRTHTKPKDVLLNITGASIGRCAYVPENLKIGNVNQHVCIIRLNGKRVSYKYLTFYLNSPSAQITINRINSGATREALTLEQIKNFTFPLCTIEEQFIIVQELEAKYTLIENLESSISHGLKTIENSRFSILKEAFEGKLNSRISREESVQVLIQRIQIEKKKYLENSIEIKIFENKPMKNKALKEILNENFGDQEFSFDDIRNKVFLPYEKLKDQLYLLLDELYLETIYNKELQKIQFRLRP